MCFRITEPDLWVEFEIKCFTKASDLSHKSTQLARKYKTNKMAYSELPNKRADQNPRVWEGFFHLLNEK